ncbi:hypothetical protein DPMN_154708 [Dreissena polymorpha]|uniref:Uncharacterized protein n=1 Tax=Dreissena polymorpha TaxID=45954 RepID=A0A9D4J9C9_DREPO|nr:hypothetical protein DPMN_154708 [Dreissena polymorpha]
MFAAIALTSADRRRRNRPGPPGYITTSDDVATATSRAPSAADTGCGGAGAAAEGAAGGRDCGKD